MEERIFVHIQALGDNSHTLVCDPMIHLARKVYEKLQ